MGIVLLIISFAVAYSIVTGLQNTLGGSLSSANPSTGPLVYATFEAVFLGVMAALGYGLITKGLDGIRRQELLEAGELYAAPVVEPMRRAAPMTVVQAKPKPAPAAVPSGRPTGTASQPARPEPAPRRTILPPTYSDSSDWMNLPEPAKPEDLTDLYTSPKIETEEPKVEAPPEPAPEPAETMQVEPLMPSGTPAAEEEPAEEVAAEVEPEEVPVEPQGEVMWEGAAPVPPTEVEVPPETESQGTPATVGEPETQTKPEERPENEPSMTPAVQEPATTPEPEPSKPKSRGRRSRRQDKAQQDTTQ